MKKSFRTMKTQVQCSNNLNVTISTQRSAKACMM